MLGEIGSSISLNTSHAPPVTGALGVIGLGGRACYLVSMLIITNNISEKKDTLGEDGLI